jgi:hypothetical protein
MPKTAPVEQVVSIAQSGAKAEEIKWSGIVQAARDRGQPPWWTPSLGHDPAGREEVLVRAAELGRLSAAHAAALLPHRDQPNQRLQRLLAESKLLRSPAERDAA